VIKVKIDDSKLVKIEELEVGEYFVFPKNKTCIMRVMSDKVFFTLRLESVYDDGYSELEMENIHEKWARVMPVKRFSFEDDTINVEV